MSCSTAGDKSEESSELLPDLKYFFDFDKIEHYSIEISESEVYAMYPREKEGSYESRMLEVLEQNIPKEISDSSFIDNLKGLGYQKALIAANKFKEIREIFREKRTAQLYAFSCIPIYRDILIFKKNNEIIGLTKICFDCDMSHIVGTPANTSYFGMNGDYAKLYRLLYSDDDRK